jgi:cation diffusion facilitator CzcD-associated flavoprotein CzcO
MNDLTLEAAAAQDEIFDLLVVGAGPAGLACSIEA